MFIATHITLKWHFNVTYATQWTRCSVHCDEWNPQSFISHMCRELQLFVLEKPHYIEVTTHSKYIYLYSFFLSLSLSPSLNSWCKGINPD